MIDLGPMTDKFSEAGQKVVRRAIDESKSRDHNFLGVIHLFMALIEVESALYVETMQAIGVDPNSVTLLLEEELAKSPIHVGRKMAIPEQARDLLNRALRRARAQGRRQIESYDLFAMLFTDMSGPPAEILRRLGVDPPLAISASDTISQRVRRKEEQKRMDVMKDQIIKIWKLQSFNFSRLTPDFLNSMVTMREKGVTPALWDTTDVSLTEHERQRVEAITSSLTHKSIVLMNEATIWSRAIYPLLVLAEQGGIEAWSQLPLKAQYPRFCLEGIADGVVGHNISGLTKSFSLIVVQVKREPEAQDPLIQICGAMLAAARLNWERENRLPQEIFGCYTIADNWTFAHGLVSDIEADRPTMSVASSREYVERIEAETILRILKSITGKYTQETERDS
ncbi:MAG TPA: Clp protease N-terminal domain-containing protein [Blastocatellia bacterium]|nr:Clp protease N-terminal domain-containing protein [Blastocatellia bacterium]